MKLNVTHNVNMHQVSYLVLLQLYLPMKMLWGIYWEYFVENWFYFMYSQQHITSCYPPCPFLSPAPADRSCWCITNISVTYKYQQWHGGGETTGPIFYLWPSKVWHQRKNGVFSYWLKPCSVTIFSHKASQTAKFMGPTWGPPGPCRPQMGPMLAPWTLLSSLYSIQGSAISQLNVTKHVLSQWQSKGSAKWENITMPVSIYHVCVRSKPKENITYVMHSLSWDLARS